MKVQTFKKVKLTLVICLAISIAISLALDTALIAFVAMGLYMASTSLLKTRVTGLLADERQKDISEKASRVSFQILMPMLVLVSVALTFGSGNQEFYYIKAVGVILSYIVCLGLAIYLLTYFYFDKKTGGR